jgi:hypothetical protein
VFRIILSCGETIFSLIPLLQLPFWSAQHVKTYREYQTTWDHQHSWKSFRTLLMWLYVTHDQEIFKLSTHVHPITFTVLLSLWQTAMAGLLKGLQIWNQSTRWERVKIYLSAHHWCLRDHPTRRHLR